LFYIWLLAICQKPILLSITLASQDNSMSCEWHASVLINKDNFYTIFYTPLDLVKSRGVVMVGQARFVQHG